MSGTEMAFREMDDRLDAARAEIVRLRTRVVELEDLQQGLHPDWKSAPEWANYWAMDRDGTSFWYAQEPILDDYFWNNKGPYSRCEAAISERWIDSLCRRPVISMPV